MLDKYCDYECYTDGAHRRSKDVSSWAFVIYDKDGTEFSHSGTSLCSTNNAMEMKAMIELFKELNSREYMNKIIHVCSDSKYLLNGLCSRYTSLNDGSVTEKRRWIDGWQDTNWITSSMTPVLNKDLWIELNNLLYTLSFDNEVEFFHTKGHGKGGEVPGNDYADYLCNKILDEYLGVA